ncbi:MAG: S9 family peptidase [Myxococcales bacterium]|nr:S9 family peptidase [Myxococcales bacterium]
MKRITRSLGALMARVLASIALLCVSVVASNAASPDPLAVAFGTMPELWGVRISPDGTKVSFLQMHPEELSVLRVLDLTTGEASLALASTRDGFNLNWCDWANDERLLCSFIGISKSARSYAVTRLVAINADGSEMKVLLQRQANDYLTQFLSGVVDWLVDDPRHVLVEVPNAMPGSIDVHRRAQFSSRGNSVRPVDIYTGDTGSPVERQGGSVTWRSDGRGSARLYWRWTRKDSSWKYRRSGESKWRKLHKAKLSDLDDHYYPVGFGKDPDALLVIKPHEGRLALWSEDLKGERDDEVVFSHPDVDVGGTLVLGKFKRTVAIAYHTDQLHWVFFDETLEKIFEMLTSHYPGKIVAVIDESWDRRYYIVYVGSDRDSGTFYRFDVEKKQLLKISPQYPQLESRSLSPMKPIRYPARDGTVIPGYLTLPEEVNEGPYPMVILPHGGPGSHYYWGFDPIVQFLAAKGYAVLQSNYRGSGFYGKIWTADGGFRAWRSTINDLTDGAKYLVEQGVVDPARICVVGWGYGGYAALMSGVVEPERYQCLVSIAGVTDPEMLIEDHAHFVNKHVFEKFIGRADEVIKRGSPLRRASEIRAPVLLFHGEDDLNVLVHHSQRMAKALKRAKKSVEYIEYERVEHSIRRNDYRVDMLDRIGSFLDAHIGQPTAAPEPARPVAVTH